MLNIEYIYNMFYHYFKISILSLCIIILIHYIINYLKITLTKPKIMDYTFKQKKQEKQENQEKQKKQEKQEEDINFMRDELTEFLNRQI